MKIKILPIFVILFFVSIFLALYKGLDDSNIYTPDVNRKNIPIFKTKNFYSGKNLESSNIFEVDKTYLLNIWSSWCVPCRQEHSILMSFSESKKVDVIGINYKDSKKNAQRFLNELGNPYEKIIFDKEGIYAIEWGAYGVPESFLIHNGMIIKKYIGPLNSQSIKEIKQLIE